MNESTSAEFSGNLIGWNWSQRVTDNWLSQLEGAVSSKWAGLAELRFSWFFRPFQLFVTTTSLFNRDNMATAASRYYNEDGRATKRQKTDGMATVSWLHLLGSFVDTADSWTETPKKRGSRGSRWVLSVLMCSAGSRVAVVGHLVCVKWKRCAAFSVGFVLCIWGAASI